MSNMLRSLSDAIWPPNQKNKVSPEPTDETSEEKSGPVSKSKESNDNVDPGSGSGENLSPSQSSTGSMSKTAETPSETTEQTSPSTSQVSKISSESTVRTPLGLRDYHLYYEVEDDDVALNPYCCCSATMRQAAEIVCFWDIILCIILTMILVLLGFIVQGAPGEYNAYEICALIFTPLVVVASLILYLVIKYKIYDTLVEKVCIAWLIVTILHLIVLVILSIGHIVYYIESGDELPMNGKDTQIEGNSTSSAGNGARADNDNNNDDSVIDNPNSEGQMLIIKVQKPKPEYLPSKESINEKRKNKYLTLIILPWIWIVLTIYFLMVIIPFLKWIRKRIKDELGDGKSEPDPENAFENPVPASGGQSSDESSAAGSLENPASAKRGDKILSSEDQSQSKDKEPSGSEGKSGSNSEEMSGEKSDDKSEKPVSEDSTGPKKFPVDGLPPSDQYPDPSTYHSSQHEPEKMHPSGTEGEPQTQPTAGGPESQEKPPESTKKSGLKSRFSSKSPKSGQKGKEPEQTPSERYTAPSVYHSSQHEPEKMPPSETTGTPAAGSGSSKNPKKDPKVSSTKQKSRSKKPDPELTPSERYTEPSEYHSSQHEPEKMPPSETEESSKLKAQKKNPKSYAQNRSRW